MKKFLHLLFAGAMCFATTSVMNAQEADEQTPAPVERISITTNDFTAPSAVVIRFQFSKEIATCDFAVTEIAKDVPFMAVPALEHGWPVADSRGVLADPRYIRYKFNQVIRQASKYLRC